MTTGSRALPPAPLTSFVGRETETDEVSRLLTSERLVTLTGPGGCGKSRLAERLVRVLLRRGRAVTWVELGPLSAAELLPQRVAHALDAPTLPDRPVMDIVEGCLGDRDHVLVLDTCEHLSSAVASLAARLLRSCPGLRVLATSRQPVGVNGEVIWPVPPLSTPAGGSAGDVVGSEAGRLFVERATRVAPGFRITDANAPAVAEICHRLDGLPLPLELAAARCRVLSPERIARGLDDRFRLLGTSDPTGEPRHRTLLASIEWSHALLTAQERRLLRAVGVYAGGFALDGALAVAPACAVEPEETLDLLTALVDRSLVEADTSPPEPRYRLLDTIRAFARDQLTKAGEAERASSRHYDHLLEVVRQQAPLLLGAASEEAFAAIDRELDDVRQALDWATRAGDAQRTLLLTDLLHWYWRVRGPVEGRDRLEAALCLGGSDAQRCPALVTLASLEMVLGDIDDAFEHATTARRVAERIGDEVSRGRALAFLGWLTIMRERDLSIPTAILEEAVRVSAAVGDGPIEALAHNALGFSVIGLPPGRDLARQHIERGMALGRRIGFERPVAEGELWLAYLEWVEGDLEAAHRRLQRVLAAGWSWEPLLGAVGRSIAVEVCTTMGEFDRAMALLQHGLDEVEEAGEKVGAAHLRLAAGFLRHATGDLGGAADDLTRAHPVLEQAMVREAARCEELFALVALRRGDRDMAVTLAERCPAQARTFPYIPATAPGLKALALAHHLDGDPVVALDVWHEHLAACDAVGHRPGVCDAFDGLAGCLVAVERYDEAARILGAADAMRRTLRCVRFPVDQPAYDEAVQRIGVVVGAEQFETLTASGAALPWDDAVALVQRGRGARGRPSHGWHSLTPTELRVVGLVAEGLTNPQIAGRMFVSPRTVQSHLRHVFAKLDVATRSELAAMAVSR